MEFEHIITRLDFLEKQQRASKDALAVLSERLDSFESSVNAVSNLVKNVDKQLTDIMPAARRMQQFDELLAKQRSDIAKIIEESEKKHIRDERDNIKRFQTELAGLQKTVLQTSTSMADMKKTLKERGSEMQRMLDNVTDFKTQVEQATRSNNDAVSSLKAMDDMRKSDLKRMADIQGELTAIRKRVDENRDKNAAIADGIRNVENRLTDLFASEQERKQAQKSFFEQQAMAQIDRDHAWKEWREKFDIFQKEAASLEAYVNDMDETMRGAKKAQDTYLELNAKLERRINEVTELQRLAEDRLRQEWLTFKTDDQKRWTGYSLSSEESFRDIRKDMQKAEEHLTSLNMAKRSFLN